MAHRALICCALVCATGAARADSAGANHVEEITATSKTWPLTVDIHPMIGTEPKGSGHNLIAFGLGGELLWKGRIGGFAAVLGSEGSPEVTSSTEKAFPDRISVPFGFAARPFAYNVKPNDTRWVSRFLQGIDVQLGISVEHIRTSDDSVTTAGLHLGLGFEVPVYGGPRQGGLSLRFQARGVFTPSVDLESNKSVHEPAGSGQLYAGVAFYP